MAENLKIKLKGLDGNYLLPKTHADIVDVPNGEGVLDLTTKLGNIDTAVANNTTAISNEVTRATGVEDGIKTRLTTAEADIDALETGKADKATTLSGYGITDAYTKSEVDTELAKKVDKVEGKGLSTEDYTTAEKTKLADIEDGAQVNKIEKVKVNKDGTTTELPIDSTDKSVTVEIPAAAEYAIVKLATPSTGMVASYQLEKDGVKAGVVIDVPKDFLVKSASVKTCEVPDVPVPGYKVGDKYIDFVINTRDGSGEDEHLYIIVTDLIDVYTSGNGLTLSDNKFSVALTTTNSGLKFDGATEDQKTLAVDTNYIATKTYVDGEIDAVEVLITAEETRAKAAEEANAAAITAEETRAKAAEEANATAIETEKSRAEDAESALNTKVDNHIADEVKHITAAERTAWNAKQTALDETQMAAVNSGINATKVGEYDAHLVNSVKHITAAERTAWDAKQNEMSGSDSIDISASYVITAKPMVGAGETQGSAGIVPAPAINDDKCFLSGAGTWVAGITYEVIA